MGEVCGRCKRTADYKYWAEFPPDQHHFFKTMVGDFRNQLRLPAKFMTHFEMEIEDQCVLRGPSGKTWKVDLIKVEDEEWLFVNEWEGFAEDHHLDLFDFLVFTYKGRSSFDVMVLDQSGCDKEVCFFIEEGKNSCSRGSCIIEGPSSSRRQDPAQDVNLESQAYRLYYVSNRRRVTPEERKSAYKRAIEHSNNSKNSFLIIMLPTMVAKAFLLKIPKAWATEHIPRNCKEILFTVEGLKKEWRVGCKWIRTDQCEIRAQWHTFVWDNNLEVDDVCVFKLIGNRTGPKLKMKTTIFRVVDPFVQLTMERP